MIAVVCKDIDQLQQFRTLLSMSSQGQIKMFTVGSGICGWRFTAVILLHGVTVTDDVWFENLYRHVK